MVCLLLTMLFKKLMFDLTTILEQERADRSEMEAKLSELNQNFAPATTVSEKLTPDVATILS
jgi:hypothetical protein